MSKIYVIAGNMFEAERWIKDHLEKRSLNGETTLSRSEYVYVRDPSILRGIKNPSGYFVGSWRKRSDIYEVVLTILSRTHHDKKTSMVSNLWRVWYALVASAEDQNT